MAKRGPLEMKARDRALLEWARVDAPDKAARELEMARTLAKEAETAARAGKCRTALKHLRNADVAHGAGHTAERAASPGRPEHSGKGIEERNIAAAAFAINCIADGKFAGAPKRSGKSRRKSRR